MRRLLVAVISVQLCALAQLGCTGGSKSSASSDTTKGQESLKAAMPPGMEVPPGAGGSGQSAPGGGGNMNDMYKNQGKGVTGGGPDPSKMYNKGGGGYPGIPEGGAPKN